MTKAIVFILLLSIWITTVIHGQEKIDTFIDFDPVTVTATRIDIEYLTAARSVYVLEHDSLAAARQHLSLADQLNQVPGIFNLNGYNYAQDLRISMRGFGSRSAFGVRGIKVLLDGVPVTTPDGQSQFDHLAPESIGRVEVIRGAASGLYGNAAGGLISLESAKITKTGAEIGLMTGSYNTYRGNLKYNLVKADWRWQGMASYFTQQGYRDHSGTRVFQIQTRLEKDLKRGVFQAFINYTNSPQADDPGGINLESVMQNRRQARDRNISFAAGEEVAQLVASSVLKHQLSDKIEMEGRVFLTARDFANRLPFENGGQVDLSRIFYGLTWQIGVSGNQKHKWSVGLDLENQRDNRERFDNVLGERGQLTLDQKEQFFNAGLFALSKWFFTDRWNLESAVRIDHIDLTVKDAFDSDGDQTGSRNYLHVSPTLGLSYRLTESQTMYTSYGHSFESPTLSALSSDPDGGGGFNADLEPLLANHYELGLRGQSQIWNYQIALFHIDLKNELIPFEIDQFPGRTFFRNSGASVRNGLELAAQAELSKSFSTGVSYSYSRFEFGEGNSDITGKQTPGVPQHNVFWQFSWRSEKGLSAGLDLRHQGVLFADDENTVEVEAATIVDLRIGYRKSNYTLYGGVRNLFGEKYFDNIRINAFGGRYYEAAPLANWYAGVKVGL